MENKCTRFFAFLNILHKTQFMNDSNVNHFEYINTARFKLEKNSSV